MSDETKTETPQAAEPQPQTPPSPYFGSISALASMSGPEAVQAMTGMVARAKASLQSTLDSLREKPELPQELWTAILSDLDAWNVLVFANLGVNIPPSYYDPLYGAVKAATYRALEWAQKP